MLKRIISITLALALLSATAVAEVFTGSTVARNTLSVTADAAGILDEITVQTGSVVQKGEIIAALRTTRVFANQDGTVARIHAKEDKEIQGPVLEIAPVSRYTIHCTSDGAYDSISANLVHCGETLYLYCTKNGTHQGRGKIYSIDGETYMVEATAGEFYPGETVYLYRDPDYSKKQRVGVGTVVSSSTETYESKGKISAIHVSEGEYVEKGELLYEVIDGNSIEIASPADGIITACDVSIGASLRDGQSVASLVPYEEICVAVAVDETRIEQISVGSAAYLSYFCDEEETVVSGIVSEITGVAQNGSYTAYIIPEQPPAQLGLSVEAWIDPGK